MFRLTGGDARCPILAGLACGTVFGVPLGLMVADWASWRWTFGLIVGVGLCAMLGIGLLGRGRIANVETPSAGARFATLGKGSNVVTMLVTLCTGIASLGLYTYFIPLLDGLGLSSARVWLIWVWGIGGAIGALFVGRVVDAAQRSTVVTAMITALLLLSFLMLAWNPSVIVVVMSILCWGSWGGLHLPLSSTPLWRTIPMMVRLLLPQTRRQIIWDRRLDRWLVRPWLTKVSSVKVWHVSPHSRSLLRSCFSLCEFACRHDASSCGFPLAGITSRQHPASDELGQVEDHERQHDETDRLSREQHRRHR